MSLRLTPSEIATLHLHQQLRIQFTINLKKQLLSSLSFLYFHLRYTPVITLLMTGLNSYLQCILVFPHFRLIVSIKLTVPGKLISSDAGRVHLHTSHTILQRQKNKHHLKKLSPPCQDLLFFKKETSLVAFVAQHTLYPQTTFHCVSNKNSPMWREKSANV